MSNIFTQIRRRVVMVAACGVAFFGATEASAVRAYPGIIDYEQPDGSVIQIRISGDERGRQIYDLDGRQLRYEDDGRLVPADEDYIAYRSKVQYDGGTRFLFSGTPFPCTGEPHGLVVLAEFSDKKFSMDDPKDFYTRMLNEEGFSDYDATGSARDFFIENSMGQFKPVFDVYGPVSLPLKYSYYGANDSYYNEDQHPDELLIECMTALDPEVDFSQYDHDGDGQIDNVFVFYAGYGEADSGIPNTIWPHSADLVDFHLGKNYYFDGVMLNRYGMTNEVDYSYKRPDGVGTFIHEFSHVLGLPDLYCTNYSYAFTPGEYSALDYGPYNNQGRTPPYYSIFERYCLGWMTPEEIDETGDYELDNIVTSNRGFIVHTENDDEVFLFENRQKTGWDKYIPGHGMLVWHIDFVQKVWDNNTVNNKASHQYADLIEADNRQTDSTRDGDPFPGTQHITEFSASTKPALVSWNKLETGVELGSISEENGMITFRADVTRQSSGIDAAEIASSGLHVEGNRIVNSTGEEAVVWNISGAKVATIDSGDSRMIPSGIYVVSAGNARLKISVR